MFCTAGNGVIVHSSQGMGLIVVDRSTVPVNGGNITLSFGAYPDEIAGRVRFLHPLHNFAIVSYNPGNLSRQVRLTSQSMPQSCSAVVAMLRQKCLHKLCCSLHDVELAVTSALVSCVLIVTSIAIVRIQYRRLWHHLQEPHTHAAQKS